MFEEFSLEFDEALSTLQFNGQDSTLPFDELHSIHSAHDRSSFEFLLCNLFFIREDAEALLQLSRQLEHSPSQPLVEGSYWSLVGQHKKSILCFTQMLERSPECYDAWLLLGHEYRALQMLKEAIACYMKATQMNQTDYRGFFALAQAYSQDINDPMAYYFFMRTLSIQCVLNGAIILMSRQQFPRGWLALGDFFAARNETKKAMDAFQRGQRCLEFDEKESRVCLLRLCQLQLREGTETRENLVNWVKRARKAKDWSLFSPEGMEILRIVLQRYRNLQTLHSLSQFQRQAQAKIEEVAAELAERMNEMERENASLLDDSDELWSLVDFLLAESPTDPAVRCFLSKQGTNNPASSSLHPSSAPSSAGDRNQNGAMQSNDWKESVNFDNSNSSSDVSMSIDSTVCCHKQYHKMQSSQRSTSHNERKHVLFEILGAQLDHRRQFVKIHSIHSTLEWWQCIIFHLRCFVIEAF